MRTKHILTALAIPALLAACVADDFNEAITSGDMAQRALLSEDFKLNFGGPETRFSAGEGSGLDFSYEVGDKIGGAIIDEFSFGEGGKKEFKVVPYVSTNHPFVLNEQGVWSIEHTMVEGNYLFYFPYNENNHARTAPTYSIPVMQDLSGKDGKFDPKAAVEKYSMGVGAQFLDKEDLSASLQLVNIFGYLHLNIVVDNHFPDGTVDKVVLQAPDGQKFTVAGQLSNKKISDLFGLLKEPNGQKLFDEKLEKGMLTTEAFAIQETEEEGYEEDAKFYDDEMERYSTVIVGKAPEGTKLSDIGQGNKGFETYMVIPATDGLGTNGQPNTGLVTIYLYTNEGDIYSETVSMDKFYVTRNKVRGLTVNVDKAESVPYVVTSEADWNNNVAMLNRSQNGENAAKFIIANNDFAITNNTKFPTNGARINITAGDLKVTGNNVTIKNVSAGTVIIEKGAKLTTDGTFAAKNVENNGELVFAPVYDEEDTDKVVDYTYATDEDKNVAGVKEVSNEATGKVTVSEKAIATFKLTNKIDKDKASIHGEMTIAKDAEVTLTSGSTNTGLITNNGTLGGNFTNDQEEIIEAAGVPDEENTNRYTPTIVNNANIRISDGNMANNGLVENKQGAEISCVYQAGASIANAGKIDLAVGSRMLITSNANGEVILHALNQANWTIQSKDGVVAYETTAADNTTAGIDFEKTGMNITKLYVTGSLNIAKMGSKLNDIEMTEDATDATLILPEKAAWSNGTLTVKEGANVVIAEAKASTEGMTLGILNVEKKATLTINETYTLNVAEVDNDGTVYVGGTLNATETDENNAGDGKFLTTSGTSGQINFGGEPIKDDDVKKALANLYATWIGNTGSISTNGEISWDNVVAIMTGTVKGGTEWTTTGVWKTAMDAVVTAANLKLTEGRELDEFRKYLQSDAVTKVITNTVNTAKTAADELLKNEIEKTVTLNWLGANVYLEKTANNIIEVGTENSDNPTTLAEGFEAYIGSATGFLSGRGNSNKAEKEMILSAKSYTYTAGDEPDFSYAPAYAGTTEYDVLNALNQIAKYENENNAGAADKWFGESSAWYTHDSFNDLATIKEAVAAVVDKMDDLTGMEGIFVKQFKLEEKALEVVGWEYRQATITELNKLFAE